jgi:acyl carrier protein
MEKSVFLSELQDALMLEDETLQENSSIQLTSLTLLSVIAFFDEKFNKQVNTADLRNVQSVTDLIQLIGNENIE